MLDAVVGFRSLGRSRWRTTLRRFSPFNSLPASPRFVPPRRWPSGASSSCCCQHSASAIRRASTSRPCSVDGSVALSTVSSRQSPFLPWALCLTDFVPWLVARSGNFRTSPSVPHELLSELASAPAVPGTLVPGRAGAPATYPITPQPKLVNVEWYSLAVVRGRFRLRCRSNVAILITQRSANLANQIRHRAEPLPAAPEIQRTWGTTFHAVATVTASEEPIVVALTLK